jgi:predicted O-methyltransferase YrrM
MNDWLTKILENPSLRLMGHGQRLDDRNLGLGWLYYGLTRALRAKTVVVIGSYRGFAPLVFARALADNLENGTVYFIDPSFVNDFWKNPQAVQTYFASFGSDNIRHFLMTTQQFIGTQMCQSLRSVDIVFVDGYHSEEQARFDYQAFRERLAPNGLVQFHDSIHAMTSQIYGANRSYEHRVKEFIETLKQDRALQVFDLPYAQGVTLVRRAEIGATPPGP